VIGQLALERDEIDKEMVKLNERLERINSRKESSGTLPYSDDGRGGVERRRSSSSKAGARSVVDESGDRFNNGGALLTCAFTCIVEICYLEYGMSSSEFRKRGRSCIDWIVDYSDNIVNRRVVPSIEPGYLRELVSAP